MKRNTKKGFTLVELVIVIAVIAILAGVLIPTFSNVVAKAQESAAIQEAVNAYKEAYAIDMADGKLDGASNGITVDATTGTATGYTYTTKDGNYVVTGTFTSSNTTWVATKK